MQIYCERCGPGLFDEPLNAASNAVFLVAAFAAWWNASRRGVLTLGLWALIVLSACVGVGSALWHTFAESWAMVLDIVPIMLFQFTFLWLYGRYAAGLSRGVVGAILAAYIALGWWLTRYDAWLNGSLIYAPAVVLAWVVGVHHARSNRPLRFALLGSAGVFCLALVCRSIDLVVCRQLPIGTHFLWHVLNGAVVYLAMRVLIEVWAERRANNEPFSIEFEGATEAEALLRRFVMEVAAIKAAHSDGLMIVEERERIIAERRWLDLLDTTTIARLTDGQHWQLEDILDCLLSGEYQLLDVEFVDGRGRLLYNPLAFPFGGTDPLKALVEVFGFRVTRDSFYDEHQI